MGKRIQRSVTARTSAAWSPFASTYLATRSLASARSPRAFTPSETRSSSTIARGEPREVHLEATRVRPVRRLRVVAPDDPALLAQEAELDRGERAVRLQLALRVVHPAGDVAERPDDVAHVRRSREVPVERARARRASR